MKIVLVGPQGSGKGTIGRLLAEKLSIPFVGMGETLRAIPKGDPYYDRLHELIDVGELAPHKMVADIVFRRLSEFDCLDGFVLDGYPRDLAQVALYDPDPDWLVVLDIPTEISLKRITGRRICDADGQVYNIYTLPKEELEKCKGKLVQRDDDTEEAVTKRLEIYATQTKKVIEYYDKRHKVLTVNAEESPAIVLEKVLEALKTAND